MSEQSKSASPAPVDLDEVAKLVASLEQDLAGVKAGSRDLQALRDEMEKERAKHAEMQQSDRRSHRDVVAEFERTVQEIREQMETHHGKK